MSSCLVNRRSLVLHKKPLLMCTGTCVFLQKYNYDYPCIIVRRRISPAWKEQISMLRPICFQERSMLEACIQAWYNMGSFGSLSLPSSSCLVDGKDFRILNVVLLTFLSCWRCYGCLDFSCSQCPLKVFLSSQLHMLHVHFASEECPRRKLVAVNMVSEPQITFMIFSGHACIKPGYTRVKYDTCTKYLWPGVPCLPGCDTSHKPRNYEMVKIQCIVCCEEQEVVCENQVNMNINSHLAHEQIINILGKAKHTHQTGCQV